MNSLARLLVTRGEYEEAEALLVEAIELRRDKLGPEHPDVGRSLVNLAVVLHAEGRLDEADQLVQQGIELQRETLGNDHPELARSLLELADIAEALGDSARADHARHEANDICSRRECPIPPTRFSRR
jgi:tetratricopeptide (TPR) repeat protein